MTDISSTLDTVIAMVIVLLVLSLVVQAIQTLIKKIFKAKSRIVSKSLADLFKYIKGEAEASPGTRKLVDNIYGEFKKLGRVSLWKNPVVDSVAKDDLLKILDKLEQSTLKAGVEKWFDTVAQGFEERYARHMKTVAVLISIVVVVYLNASLFRVYQNIAHSDVQRSLIVSKGPEILDKAKKDAEQEAKSTATATPTPSASPRPGLTRPTSGNSSPNQPSPNPSGSPKATPKASPTPDEVKEATEAARRVSDYVSTYEEFGFKPVTVDQISTWLASLSGETQVRDEKGRILNKANQVIERDCTPTDNDGKPMLKNGQPVDCQPAWRAMTSGEWWASRRQDFQTLVGWSLMVLLLSVGAPFWEDTLSSLFGIKNLLQKKNTKSNGQDGGQAGGGPAQPLV